MNQISQQNGRVVVQLDDLHECIRDLTHRGTEVRGVWIGGDCPPRIEVSHAPRGIQGQSDTRFSTGQGRVPTRIAEHMQCQIEWTETP